MNRRSALRALLGLPMVAVLPMPQRSQWVSWTFMKNGAPIGTVTFDSLSVASMRNALAQIEALSA